MPESRKFEKVPLETPPYARSGLSQAEHEVVLLSIRGELLRVGRSGVHAAPPAAQLERDSVVHADASIVDRVRALSLLARELTRTRHLPDAARLRWLSGMGIGEPEVLTVLRAVAAHSMPNYIQHLSDTPLRWVANCET